MTESEWLASEDVDHCMIECLLEKRFPDAEPCDWKQGERKTRLFILACLARIHDELPAEYRASIGVIDPDATRPVTDGERQTLAAAADAVEWEDFGLLFYADYDDIEMFCVASGNIAARRAMQIPGTRPIRQETRQQAALFRDIFGNPFHRAALDPAWLAWGNGLAVKLAQSIYDDRGFDHLAVLSDALEEAGCTDAAILQHLRSPGPHVRGCWALDLVLGKE